MDQPRTFEFWNLEDAFNRFLDSFLEPSRPAVVISGRYRGQLDFEIVELKVKSLAHGKKPFRWDFTGLLADGTKVAGEIYADGGRFQAATG